VLSSGRGTPDLGGSESCSSFARAVVDTLRHTYGAPGPKVHWGLSTA
jgi:hypothetical protein